MLFSDPAFDHYIAVFDDPMFENDRISSCWRFEVSSVLPGIIHAMYRLSRAGNEHHRVLSLSRITPRKVRS